MKRLLIPLLLAACSEPATVPEAAPPQAPPGGEAVAGQTTLPAAPTPAAPAVNTPEEAAEIARAHLAAQHPGAAVEMGEPGRMEGAAGSIYIEIPATVTEGDRALSGAVVLRRVNDVPGSTAEQRRWHIERVDLK